MSWNEIEIAPKDGTEILVSDKDFHQLHVAFFDSSPDGNGWFVTDGKNFHRLLSDAVYWTPVPERSANGRLKYCACG